MLPFSVSPWVWLLVSVCALAGALKFHYVIVLLLLFCGGALIVFYTSDGTVCLVA